MISLREKIEDGIIETISAALLKTRNTTTGYLATVAPYNGQVDQEDGPDDLIRAFRGKYPGILVGPGGSSFDAESVARTRFKRVVSVDLYFASNHMRTRESRHRGDVVAGQDDTADPGIYTIIEDVFSLIAGNDLQLDCVGPLGPIREDLLIQEKTLTVWRVSYETDTDAHVKPRDFGDQALTATLVKVSDADVDESAFPDYNPVVQAEQDHT